MIFGTCKLVEKVHYAFHRGIKFFKVNILYCLKLFRGTFRNMMFAVFWDVGYMNLILPDNGGKKVFRKTMEPASTRIRSLPLCKREMLSLTVIHL